MYNNTYTRADYEKEKKRYQIIKEFEDDMFISQYVVEVLNRLPDETDRDNVEVIADIWNEMDGRPREFIGKTPFDKVLEEAKRFTEKCEADVATGRVDEFAENQEAIEMETTQIKKEKDDSWNAVFEDMPENYGNPIDYIETIPDREYGTEIDPDKLGKIKEINRLARVLEQSGYCTVGVYANIKNEQPSSLCTIIVKDDVYRYVKTAKEVFTKMITLCDDFGISTINNGITVFSFGVYNVWKSKIVIKNPHERNR